jgi:hypothetical protein
VAVGLSYSCGIDRTDRLRYKNLQRTYFAKKMLTYYEATRQRQHVRDLGIEHFRVATVTTTPERVEQMLEALRTITDGRGIEHVFVYGRGEACCR